MYSHIKFRPIQVGFNSALLEITDNDKLLVQGESKKTDTFDIQMNNKGVSFF
jgi:hypothetical protein